MRLTVKADVSDVEDGFKKFRRLNDGYLKGAMKTALGIAQGESQRRVASHSRLSRAIRPGSSIARDGMVKGYLSISFIKVPFAPLLLYGGVRRDVIRPRNGKAVVTPWGPRAAVYKPRRYKGHDAAKIAAAIDAKRGAVMDELLDAVEEAFSDSGFTTRG